MCYYVGARDAGCVCAERLRVCQHDVAWLLEGVDLKKERLKWHPDKYPGRKETMVLLAQEMFQLVQKLVDG